MRSLNRRILALTIGAAAGACALPATAPGMEIAMQDDLTIVDGVFNRDLALTQFKDMGGTHVRIGVKRERRSSAHGGAFRADRSSERYDGAIEAILDHDLTPQVALYYRNEKRPGRWKSWARDVVSHFGRSVNRYSIGNEPDLYEVEDRRCTRRVQRQLRRQFPDEIRGNRAEVATKAKTVRLKDACNRYQRGITYRKIFGPAAKGVKQGNRRAQILAGETSPNAGLDWFMKSVRPKALKRKGADGWAHHPYQFQNLNPNRKTRVWGIGEYRLLKKTVRMPIYLTEFGYPKPKSEMDDRYYGGTLTDRKVARANVKAFRLARKRGARQMLQYQWYTKPDYRTEIFDTSILESDDGETTPQYEALKRLITSW